MPDPLDPPGLSGSLGGGTGTDPLDPLDPLSNPLNPAAGHQEFAIFAQVLTPTAAAGYTVSEQELSGSPFTGYLEVLEKSARRDEASPGTATIDDSPRLWLDDVSAPVNVGHIALLPQEAIKSTFSLIPGGFELVREAISRGDLRARIQRVRLNAGKLECAVELGAV